MRYAGSGLAPSIKSAQYAVALQWHAARWWAVLPLVSCIVSGILPPSAALAMRSLTNAVSQSASISDGTLLSLVAAVVGLGLATQLLGQLTRYADVVVQQRLVVETGRRLYERLSTYAGLGHLEDPAFRDRLALAEQVAQTAPATISTSFQQTVQAGISLLSYAGALYLVWPPILPLLLAVSVLAVITENNRGRRSADATMRLVGLQRLAFQHRQLFTDVAVAKEMRVFGFGRFLLDRFLDASIRGGRELVRIERTNAAVEAGLLVVSTFVIGCGLWLVAQSVAKHSLQIGDLALFAVSSVAVQSAIATVSKRFGDVAKTLRLIPNYIDVCEKGSGTEVAGTHKASPLDREIVFRDVWFRYSADGAWVLRGLDLTLRAGETTGIVGLNGAGKTTMFKLLCRFYDPYCGEITWDGVDLQMIDPASLREHIAALFQDFKTYEFTVAENIGIGAPSDMMSQFRIQRAAVSTQLDAEIMALPRGYETLLSRQFADQQATPGALLSGGQSQRLALARGVMKERASVWILDEPTASSDPQNEELIYSNLFGNISGTRIIASHRLSGVREADHIVVMADGRVVEEGTHANLMQAGTQYASLFRTQASRYSDLTPCGPMPESQQPVG